jgi:hypothetical protein
MSDYQREEGKLIPIELNDEIAAQILSERKIGRNDFETPLEQLLGWLDEEYIKVKGFGYFKIEGYKNHGCDLDFSLVNKNEDGSFYFHTLFYNGGTYLAEMLEEGFENLNK